MANQQKLQEAWDQVKQAIATLRQRGYDVQLDPRGIAPPKFKKPGENFFREGYSEAIEEAGMIAITTKECEL